MKDMKHKLDNKKEKILAEINEAAGKITGNEKLELKGKLLNKKADFKKKYDVTNVVNETKETIAGKINDILDKKNKQ